MISKEKKTAIIAEYARKEGDTDRYPDSTYPGADRASEKSSEGSSLQTWSAENGWTETWSACLP